LLYGDLCVVIEDGWYYNYFINLFVATYIHYRWERHIMALANHLMVGLGTKVAKLDANIHRDVAVIIHHIHPYFDLRNHLVH
jgi:hypothetical protein